MSSSGEVGPAGQGGADRDRERGAETTASLTGSGASARPPTGAFAPRTTGRSRSVFGLISIGLGVGLVALVFVVLTALFIQPACACAAPAPTLPPGAISQEDATAAALRVAPPSTSKPYVAWAQLAPDPAAPQGGKLVWLVRLEAAFAVDTCPPSVELHAPPSAPACVTEDGVTVIVDVYTGAFLGWGH